jgi:hypothetical protein
LLSGTISGNVIGTAGVTNSGSSTGDGINVTSNGEGITKVAVTNNTIREYNNSAGIRLKQGDGSGSLQATVTGNIISVQEPSTLNPAQAIFAEAGLTSDSAANHTVDSGTSCFDIGGASALANSFAGAGANGSEDFRVRQRFNTTVQLPGYGGGNSDDTAVVNFISGRNTGAPSGTASHNTPAGGGFVNTVSGAACALP